MLQSICIFLISGKTFTFRNVELVTENESVLVFNYKAMSDSNKKTATFPKANVAGWSTCSTVQE